MSTFAEPVDSHWLCYYSDLTLARKLVTTLASAASLICYCILFFLYLVDKQPCLRRHPANIMFYKCAMEVLFLYPFLFQYWMPDEFAWDPFTIQCRCSENAKFFAFQSQFALLAAELYFLVIVMDLHMQCSNPFASFQHYFKYYNYAIVGFCTFMAGVLMVVGQDNTLVGQGSNYGLWIQDYDPESNGIKPASDNLWEQEDRLESETTNVATLKVFMFYGWVVGIYCYSTYVITFVSLRLKEGLARTLTTRLSLARRAQKYVTGYTAYWVLVTGVDFLHNMLRSRYDKKELEPMHDLLAFCLAARGIVSLAVIYYTHYEEWVESSFFYYVGVIKEVPQDAENDQAILDVIREEVSNLPHLNSTLRAEVLLFTTQGIRCVIEDYNRTKNIESGNRGESEEGDFVLKKRSASMYGKSNSYQLPQDREGSNISQGSQPNFAADAVSRSTQAGDRWANKKFHVKVASKQFVYNGTVDENKRESVSRAIAAEMQHAGVLEHEVERLGADYCGPLEGILPISTSRRSSHTSVSDSTRLSGLSLQEEVQAQGRSINPMLSEIKEYPSSCADSDDEEERDEFYIAGSSLRDSTSSETRGNKKSRKMKKSVFMLKPEVGPSGTSEINVTAEHMDEFDAPLTDMQHRGSARLSTISNQSQTVVSEMGSDDDSTRKKLVRRNSSETCEEGTTGIDSSGEYKFGRESNFRSSFAPQETLYEGEEINRPWWSPLANMWDAMQSNMAQRKNFIFKDYCPELFGEIRELCGVDDTEYVESLMSTTKEKFSEGQSGSFLYFSSDLKYIVKTTNREEKDALVRILPQYLEHLRQNPGSLLVRFFGLHSIMMYNQRLQFVVMGNAFAGVSPSERYDLKGSWINRTGKSPKQKLKRGSDGGDEDESVPLFKDSDLQYKFMLRREAVLHLREQMQNDACFLATNNLMDYSLLVGVKRRRFHVQRKGSPSSSQMSFDSIEGSEYGNSSLANRDSMGYSQFPHKRSFHSTPNISQGQSGGIGAAIVEGPEEYWFTIIDVLQEWNLSKQIESVAKQILQRVDADGISAVPADVYCNRFLERVAYDAFDDTIDDDYITNMHLDDMRSNNSGTPRQLSVSTMSFPAL